MSIMQAVTVAALTWKRHRQKNMLPYGITLKQFHVLQQLEEQEALCPSEIADMIFCDRPTATVVIKNMEKQGWVKRNQDPADSRRIQITLEPDGQAKLEEIAQNQAGSQNESFDPLSCFTRAEREQLSGLLTKLNQYLEHLRSEAGDQ